MKGFRYCLGGSIIQKHPVCCCYTRWAQKTRKRLFFSPGVIIKKSQSKNFSISQLLKLARVCFFFLPEKWIKLFHFLLWNYHFELFASILKYVCGLKILKILLGLSESFSFSCIWFVCKRDMWQFHSLSDNITFETCPAVWISIVWCWVLHLHLIRYI